MNDSIPLQDAYDQLRRSKFKNANGIFAKLLENDPDNNEYINGFYVSSFWNNRVESMELRRPGRELATYLLNEWEGFEIIARERKFEGSQIMPIMKDIILGDAANHFRQTYQDEGASVVSDGLLLQLSKCLLRLGDNKNAADVLLYAKNHYSRNADFLFMLAESFSRLQDQKSRMKGYLYYRTAFLIDHRKINPDLLESVPVKTIFVELQNKYNEKTSLSIEWLPAHFMAGVFQEFTEELNDKDYEFVVSEKIRLQEQMNLIDNQYMENLKANLSFLIILLLKECNESELIALRKELAEIAPELLETCFKGD